MVLVDSVMVDYAFRIGWMVCGLIILFLFLGISILSAISKIRLLEKFLKEKDLVGEFVEWKEKRKDLRKELEL